MDPNQEIDWNAAFPSGHAAIGWLLLPLLYLVLTKNWKVKALVGTLVISWGLFVLLGRVRIGAHYASDVLFPTGVAIMTFLLLYKHYHFRKGAERKS